MRVSVNFVWTGRIIIFCHEMDKKRPYVLTDILKDGHVQEASGI